MSDNQYDNFDFNNAYGVKKVCYEYDILGGKKILIITCGYKNKKKLVQVYYKNGRITRPISRRYANRRFVLQVSTWRFLSNKQAISHILSKRIRHLFPRYWSEGNPNQTKRHGLARP